MARDQLTRSLALLAAFVAGSQAIDIFVSPDGSGDGTEASPFGDIQEAVDAAEAGDNILLREGTYAPSVNIQIDKSGTRTAPITIRSFEMEAVIIDGENMPGFVTLQRMLSVYGN